MSLRPISQQRKINELKGYMKLFTRHTPMRFHLMNIGLVVKLVILFLDITGLDKITFRNAKDLQLKRVDLPFSNLPNAFDDYKILLLTDLHIDGINELPQIIIDKVADLDYDLCILGGDYRFNNQGNVAGTVKNMRLLTQFLIQKTRVLAVLGNHDEYEIGLRLQEHDVEVLTNEHVKLTRGKEDIYICGLDDCHYYGAHDIDATLAGIPGDAFKIFVSHSPELYREAAAAGCQLYLAGHTHAGQLCLPGRIPIICQAKVPKKLIYGQWQYQQLTGYTSAGAGSSGAPARLNCPPEAVLVTLKSE